MDAVTVTVTVVTGVALPGTGVVPWVIPLMTKMTPTIATEAAAPAIHT